MKWVMCVAVAGMVSVTAAPVGADEGRDRPAIRRISRSSLLGPDWTGACEIRETTREWEWESSIAVDPDDPRRMAVAWIQDDAIGVVVASSSSGGHRWTHSIVPGLTSCTGGRWGRVFHPRLYFASDGSLYLVTHPSAEGGSPVNGVQLSHSVDGGATWGAPRSIETMPILNDFDTAVVEPDTGAFDLTWSDLEVTGDLIYLSRTTDHGETWQRRIVRRALPGTVSFNTTLALPGGRLIVVSHDASLPEFFGVPTPSSIVVTHSDDKGLTWSVPQILAGETMREWPVVTTTPDGEIHLLYRTLEGDDEKVWMTTSTDGAATWTTARPIFSLAGGEIPLPQPAIAASPGSLGVLVYDYAHDVAGDEEITVGAALLASRDGGMSWERHEIGTPFDYRTVPDFRHGNTLGFFNGIASAGCGIAASAVLGGQSDMTGPTDVYLATLGNPNSGCDEDEEATPARASLMATARPGRP